MEIAPQIRELVELYKIKLHLDGQEIADEWLAEAIAHAEGTIKN